MSATIIEPANMRGTKICLQTVLGSDIENEQSHEFSFNDRHSIGILRNRYRDAKIRTDPNPIYNCHGMVFASRRTGIHDSKEIIRILEEDGYIEINLSEVLAGDVVMYFGDDGDFLHCGIVVGLDEPLRLPLVLSKWGKFSEVVHYLGNCPYQSAKTKYYRLNVWK